MKLKAVKLAMGRLAAESGGMKAGRDREGDRLDPDIAV